MKRILVAATFVTVLCILPGRAAAAKVLASAPLQGGAGGVACSCVNLTKAALEVFIGLPRDTSTNGCNLTIDPSRVLKCSIGGTVTRFCTISRKEGGKDERPRLQLRDARCRREHDRRGAGGQEAETVATRRPRRVPTSWARPGRVALMGVRATLTRGLVTQAKARAARRTAAIRAWIDKL